MNYEELASLYLYPGLHQPNHAVNFGRACISINRLRGRVAKPVICKKLIVDSGAFIELEKYGHYRHEVTEYGQEVFRLWKNGVINPEIVVAQDFMCEPFILAKTGLTVEAHQYFTIERYENLVSELRRLNGGDLPFPVMPVLQGFKPSEYVFHLAMYQDLIPFGAWVGVGSVCKRQGDPAAIITILEAIKAVRPDLRLHGFGVKKTSLKHARIRDLLYSADSMAWSFAARKQGRDQNDWREAEAFVKVIEELAA